jgi:restriction endonuclease Mrr
MTFTEAALAVLQSEGRAMHARELADKAVEMGLLSHVGKTPVQTMSAQLSSSVAKGKENSPFVRVRPGVFALESWAGKPPGPTKSKTQTPKPKTTAPANKKVASNPNLDKSAKPTGMDRPSRPPKPQMPGSSKKKTEKPASAAPERPRRERPKRERPGSEKPKTEAPKPVASDRPKVPEKQPEPLAEATDDAVKKRRRRRRKKRPDEVAAESQQPQQSRPTQPSAPKEVHDEKKPEEPRADISRGDGEPAEMADRIENLLRSRTRPMNPTDMAAELGMKTPGGNMLVEALIVADGLELNRRGLRPRFIRHRNGFALAEREVGGEIIALERQVAEARERLIHIAERQILRKIRTVSMTNLVQVMVVHLQRLGFGDMSPVRLGRKDEFHLSMQDRRRGGRFRTAVVLKSDPPEQQLDARSVMDLRGALHHYDSMSGMIITTGSVSEAARKEGRVPNLPPVAIMDGEMLAHDLARLGIGVRERLVSLPAFDDKFFSSLDN